MQPRKFFRNFKVLAWALSLPGMGLHFIYTFFKKITERR
jgi:hypothetical protein